MSTDATGSLRLGGRTLHVVLSGNFRGDTLVRMIIMQTMGWQLYLTYNTLGSPMYPDGTNVGLSSIRHISRPN
jgi:hypothetical protein